MNSIPNNIQMQLENEPSCRRKVIIQVQLAHFNDAKRKVYGAQDHLISSMILITLSLSNLKEMWCSLSALGMLEKWNALRVWLYILGIFLLAYSECDKILSTKAISVRSKKDTEMERNLTIRPEIHWAFVTEMQIFAYKSQIGHNFYWSFCGHNKINRFFLLHILIAFTVFIVFRAKFWDCKNSQEQINIEPQWCITSGYATVYHDQLKGRMAGETCWTFPRRLSENCWKMKNYQKYIPPSHKFLWLLYQFDPNSLCTIACVYGAIRRR